MYGCNASPAFSIRSLMLDKPYLVNFGLFLISILYFGAAVRICEAPLARIDTENQIMNHYDLLNCCWAVILTMTTVGFGEIYPRTLLGRITIFLCCMYGLVIVSMIVVVLMNILEMEKSEDLAYTVIKKAAHKLDIYKDSGLVIKRFMVLKKKLRRKEPVQLKRVVGLMSSIVRFKNENR